MIPGKYMRPAKMFFAAALCLCTTAFPAETAAAREMVRGGRAVGVITFTRGNNAALEAARELQYAFEKISGVKVPVLDAVPADHRGSVIHTGYPSPAPAGLGSPGLLAPEGCMLKTAGNTLYIFGDDRLLSAKWNIRRDGTFAGVSFLLEKFFGCRYFMAGPLGEYYPKRAVITLPELSMILMPPCCHRIMAFDSKDPEMKKFARRHRLGRAFVFEGSHAFEQWYARWGKTKPELFALQPDGTRIPPYPVRSQQCITHPEFPELWYRGAVSQLNSRPELISVSASFNDAGCHFFCRCSKCRALDPPGAPLYRYYYGKGHKIKEYMPAMTDRYMVFVNAAARRLKREWPGKFVLYTAYRSGVGAPLREKVEDNVVISFAGFNYVSDRGRELSRKHFLAWRKLTPNIIVRPNFLHHGACMPLFYGRKMYADFRLCHKSGVMGWHMDAMRGHWGAAGFHYYLAARLLGDPELDYDRLFDEYCEKFYGPAAAAMKKYFLELEKFTDRIAASGNSNGIQSGWGANAPDYYTARTVASFRALLDNAAAAAGKEEMILRRIGLCREAWEYTEILCAGLREVRKAKSPQAGAKEFAALEKWRTAHAGSYGVNTKWDIWRHSCRRTAATPAAQWLREENEFVMPLEY